MRTKRWKEEQLEDEEAGQRGRNEDEEEDEDEDGAYLIEGDVLAHHAAQAVDEGREGDGARGVAVPPHLGPGAREVKYGTALQVGGAVYKQG